MLRQTILCVTSCLMTLGGLNPTLAAEDAKPTYRQVAAELFHPRKGLGNALTRLKDGQEVRIAYLGGSITQADGWRPKTLAWFRKTYPNAKINEIHAAIGGTGSDLGVFRLRQDVLVHKPHLLFVEFAVNDSGRSPDAIWRGMEGIVRQTWREDPTIDICFIYTYAKGFEKDLAAGQCPQSISADELLADHYGIPSINVALRATQLAREGKLIFTPAADTAVEKAAPGGQQKIVFSGDGVHPHDAGHQIYTDVIADAFTKMADAAQTGAHAMPAPFAADNWEGARLVPLERWMLSPGWKQMDTKKGLGHAFHSRMPQMWEATQPGESICFNFKGTLVGLYDLVGPDCPQLVGSVDGKADKPRPRFDHYCSYHRIATVFFASGLPDTAHTVKIEIHPKQPDRSIVAESRTNPAKYDGTRARIGAILLIGELIKP